MDLLFPLQELNGSSLNRDMAGTEGADCLTAWLSVASRGDLVFWDLVLMKFLNRVKCQVLQPKFYIIHTFFLRAILLRLHIYLSTALTEFSCQVSTTEDRGGGCKSQRHTAFQPTLATIPHKTQQILTPTLAHTKPHLLTFHKSHQSTVPQSKASSSLYTVESDQLLHY